MMGFKDTEEARLERLAEMEAMEPERVNAAVPGSFGCHEALDRTATILEMVGLFLLEHPAIIANRDWYHLADEAHTKLMDLYQAIGAKHM